MNRFSHRKTGHVGHDLSEPTLDFQGIFVSLVVEGVNQTSPLLFEKHVLTEFLHPAFRDASNAVFSKASQRHHREVLQHEVRCQIGGALLKLGKVDSLEDHPCRCKWLMTMVTSIPY